MHSPDSWTDDGDADDGDADDGGQTGPAFKVGSGKYFKSHLDDPLFDGARVTLREALYAILSEKRHGQIKDTSFDNYMWYLHYLLLPPGNFLPPSLYMVKRVIGVPELWEYERQACPNSCRVRRCP